MNWADAARACGGTPGDWNNTSYQPSTKLPKFKQLQAVAGGMDNSYFDGGQYGAAHAAGWPDDGYGSGWFLFWAGEGDAHSSATYRDICLVNGWFGYRDYTLNAAPVTVRLP